MPACHWNWAPDVEPPTPAFGIAQKQSVADDDVRVLVVVKVAHRRHLTDEWQFRPCVRRQTPPRPNAPRARTSVTTPCSSGARPFLGHAARVGRYLIACEGRGVRRWIVTKWRREQVHVAGTSRLGSKRVRKSMIDAILVVEIKVSAVESVNRGRDRSSLGTEAGDGPRWKDGALVDVRAGVYETWELGAADTKRRDVEVFFRKRSASR